MDHAQFATCRANLTSAREALGVHALEAVQPAGFSTPREMTMAAMICLIQASKRIGEETGMSELHQAMCAAEVPARVVQ